MTNSSALPTSRANPLPAVSAVHRTPLPRDPYAGLESRASRALNPRGGRDAIFCLFGGEGVDEGGWEVADWVRGEDDGALAAVGWEG